MQTSEKDSVHAESEEKCTEWKKKKAKNLKAEKTFEVTFLIFPLSKTK